MCDPQKCTLVNSLDVPVGESMGACHFATNELNLVSAWCWPGPKDTKPKKVWLSSQELRVQWGTQSATASHCPLSLSVSFDFLHQHRIPVPFSGNSFSVYSSQATCLPILWVLLWKEQGVTPARPSGWLSWSEPGHLHFNNYYAHYNLRTTNVGAALISSVILHCDTKECL